MTTMKITINGKAYGPTEVRDDLSMNDYLREYLGMTGTKFGCGIGQCGWDGGGRPPVSARRHA